MDISIELVVDAKAPSLIEIYFDKLKSEDIFLTLLDAIAKYSGVPISASKTGV